MDEMLPHEIVIAALGIVVMALAVFELSGVATFVGMLVGGIMFGVARAPASARAKQTSRRIAARPPDSHVADV